MFSPLFLKGNFWGAAVAVGERGILFLPLIASRAVEVISGHRGVSGIASRLYRVWARVYCVVCLLVLLTFAVSTLVSVVVVPEVLIITLGGQLFSVPSDQGMRGRTVPELKKLSFTPSVLFSLSFISTLCYTRCVRERRVPL